MIYFKENEEIEEIVEKKHPLFPDVEFIKNFSKKHVKINKAPQAQECIIKMINIQLKVI